MNPNSLKLIEANEEDPESEMMIIDLNLDEMTTTDLQEMEERNSDLPLEDIMTTKVVNTDNLLEKEATSTTEEMTDTTTTEDNKVDTTTTEDKEVSMIDDNKVDMNDETETEETSEITEENNESELLDNLTLFPPILLSPLTLAICPSKLLKKRLLDSSNKKDARSLISVF